MITEPSTKFFIGILSALFLVSMFAQEKNVPSEAEVRSDIPELTEFHGVIYKIWHEAWPSKNIQTLKDLEPIVKEKAEVVYAAKLPGIMREKQGAWSIAVDTLKAIVARYGRSSSADDSVGLLNAAEQLHRQFEVMVRIVRPALKELEEFHAVLYRLYHYDKPRKDLEKARVAAAELRERMRSLESALLPKRLQQKEQLFRDSVKELGVSVTQLNETVPTNDWALIEKQIDSVHRHYEAVSRLLE